MSDELYKGYVEDEVEEIQGITDTVTDYTFAQLSYPCIIFKDGFKLEKHKVQVISNMVKSSLRGITKDISLYFTNNGELFKVGSIGGIQVSPLIDIAGRDTLDAFLTAENPLSGDLIYTLCSSLI